MPSQSSIIREIKNELDAVVGEVEAAEERLFSLENEYNARAWQAGGAADEAGVSRLMEEKQAEQERLNLPDLYRHQNRASRKFSMISRAYEIGSGQTSERAIYHQLVGYLFRSSDDVDQVPGIEGILKQLAGALHAYFHVSFDDERERAIAAAWQPLETALRALGREI